MDEFQDGLTAHDAGNYAAALEIWRPLADQGDARAQYNLGVMYNTGRGVPRDVAEAAKWYRLAADQGYAVAQNNLGFMYDTGQGVPQDYAEAMRWYRLAADQGHARAQANLGMMYEDGNGVPRDLVTAHMWVNIASANGLEDAAELRDSLEAKMTPEDKSEAARRARRCMASSYADCD